MTELPSSLPAASALASVWTLDPGVVYLNHGAFGSTPRRVLAHQAELRQRLEREPVLFLDRNLEGLLDGVRGALAAFLGAQPEDLAQVPNATSGVNTVVRSLDFGPGDELLITNHSYHACANAVRYVAARTGARVVTASVPFPLEGPDVVVDAVLAAVTPRTRLALVDHVTSPTGLVFPVERLVPLLQARGVDVLIDGAHAPGMVPVNLDALGAAYYTANCHKWLCAPKGAAFLHVRRDRQKDIHPLTISHGFDSQRIDRSRFQVEFDWCGTDDPTAWLCIPEALQALGSLVPGGWADVRARNHGLALLARRTLCGALGISPPCPEAMIGSLTAVPLPAGDNRPRQPPYFDPLQDALFERRSVEVPVFNWPAAPARCIRASAQLYNSPEQYDYLARCVKELLAQGV